MDWIYSPQDPLLETLAGCFIIFVIIIVLTRIVGLRSFAKFTIYDFAFTVAIGSIISSILTSSTSIAQGSVAIGGLLFLAMLFSFLQRKINPVDDIISNDPLLLMDGAEILDDNLKAARIHKQQIIAKLREANVTRFEQVLAVVLESTGDISVLHTSSGEEVELEEELLSGVRMKA